jgi:hypothetical protein
MRNVDLNSSLCGQHHGPPDDLESNIQVSFVIGKAAGAKNQDFPHHSIGVGHATEGGGAKKSSKFFSLITQGTLCEVAHTRLGSSRIS